MSNPDLNCQVFKYLASTRVYNYTHIHTQTCLRYSNEDLPLKYILMQLIKYLHLYLTHTLHQLHTWPPSHFEYTSCVYNTVMSLQTSPETDMFTNRTKQKTLCTNLLSEKCCSVVIHTVVHRHKMATCKIAIKAISTTWLASRPVNRSCSWQTCRLNPT